MTVERAGLSRRRRGPLPLSAFAFFALVPAAALAQKTDVVVLLNGDHFTGEIKSYDEGRLAFNTSAAGWLSIKWNNILSVTSSKQFDVETIDGQHHYGTLAASDPPGRLLIVSYPESLTVSFFDVYDLAPVFQKFWQRWEGSLDLGFNYTQSSSLVQFNVSSEATYRVRTRQIVANLSSFFSRQNGVTAAERGSFGLRYDRFLADRWIAEGGVGFGRNIELGLNLRTTLGIAGGRNLIQTNQEQLTAIAGVLASREEPVEGDGKYSAEAIVGARYSYFMYDFPKLTISASVEAYPSLTEGGRVRVEAAGYVKREIVSDFYLSLSIFDSFDSQDPTTGQSRNDWGPTLSIGWKF